MSIPNWFSNLFKKERIFQKVSEPVEISPIGIFPYQYDGKGISKAGLEDLIATCPNKDIPNMDLGKKNILVVDDDSTNLMVFKDTLEKYNTVLVESAIEGLKVARSFEIHLIILDLMMNPVSGFDFLKYYREFVDAEKPIIVISALRNQNIKDQISQFNCKNYLTKPISTEKLANMVLSLVGV